MPFDDRDPDEADAHETRETRGVTEAIRRMVLGGVGTLLTSEETLRSAVSDLKLPKEAASYLMQQADKTKAEVVKALGRELRSFLENIDAQGLVQKAMANMVIEVKAEIRFKPSDDGTLQPSVKMETTPREHETPAPQPNGERRSHKRARRREPRS